MRFYFRNNRININKNRAAIHVTRRRILYLIDFSISLSGSPDEWICITFRFISRLIIAARCKSPCFFCIWVKLIPSRKYPSYVCFRLLISFRQLQFKVIFQFAPAEIYLCKFKSSNSPINSAEHKINYKINYLQTG